jgi:hypothetical protein
MQLNKRIGQAALVCAAAILVAACARQKEPAQLLIGDIDATVTAASAEAAKYVPEQLADVRAQRDGIKALYDKQDYAAVVAGAPAVLSAAQTLATAAASKKDEILKALNDEWSGLAGTLPDAMTAIHNRIDFLSRKSSKKAAAGIDLTAAQAGLSAANSLWSKAQAAFATGNLNEAVSTAKDVKVEIDALAASLKLTLAAPAATAGA